MPVTIEPDSHATAPALERRPFAEPDAHAAAPTLQLRVLGLIRTAARFVYNLLTDPFPR